MSAAEAEFKRELDIFSAEGEDAIKFFYAGQTVHAVAASDKSVDRALNNAPMFWNTSLGALQTATLVTVGRVFDPNPKNHTITRLLNIAHDNLDIFSKQAFAARIREINATADEWLPERLHIAYEPTSEDFRRLKRCVATHRRTYEAHYRPLRNSVFAHRGVLERAELGALFANTNIPELEQLLVFLDRLHVALWQLFYNGYKPTLRAARFSVREMREQPLPQPEQRNLPERVMHETEHLLKSLSNCIGSK
jgi:hypothetical protein